MLDPQLADVDVHGREFVDDRGLGLGPQVVALAHVEHHVVPGQHTVKANWGDHFLELRDRLIASLETVVVVAVRHHEGLGGCMELAQGHLSELGHSARQVAVLARGFVLFLLVIARVWRFLTIFYPVINWEAGTRKEQRLPFSILFETWSRQLPILREVLRVVVKDVKAALVGTSYVIIVKISFFVFIDIH